MTAIGACTNINNANIALIIPDGPLYKLIPIREDDVGAQGPLWANGLHHLFYTLHYWRPIKMYAFIHYHDGCFILFTKIIRITVDVTGTLNVAQRPIS